LFRILHLCKNEIVRYKPTLGDETTIFWKTNYKLQVTYPNKYKICLDCLGLSVYKLYTSSGREGENGHPRVSADTPAKASQNTLKENMISFFRATTAGKKPV
jgi:hypothetical protein